LETELGPQFQFGALAVTFFTALRLLVRDFGFWDLQIWLFLATGKMSGAQASQILEAVTRAADAAAQAALALKESNEQARAQKSGFAEGCEMPGKLWELKLDRRSG
jgi:hypothetical protein